MPGKNPHLTSLQTRKQLLVTESEVNRAELLKELGALKSEVSHIKKQVKAIGSLASSAALVATAVSLFRGRFGSPEKSGHRPKRSWISTALIGARVGTLLFDKIRSFLRERE